MGGQAPNMPGMNQNPMGQPPVQAGMDPAMMGQPDLRAMENQLTSMRMFSGNTRLINLLEQALEIKKGLQFKLKDVKTIGRLLGFQIQTNMQLKFLSFSYILYSADSLHEKHASIFGDFLLVDDNRKSISVLSNMDMLFVGLTQFTIPQNTRYSLEVGF